MRLVRLLIYVSLITMFLIWLPLGFALLATGVLSLLTVVELLNAHKAGKVMLSMRQPVEPNYRQFVTYAIWTGLISDTSNLPGAPKHEDSFQVGGGGHIGGNGSGGNGGGGNGGGGNGGGG